MSKQTAHPRHNPTSLFPRIFTLEPNTNVSACGLGSKKDDPALPALCVLYQVIHAFLRHCVFVICLSGLHDNTIAVRLSLRNTHIFKCRWTLLARFCGHGLSARSRARLVVGSLEL